MSTAPDTEPDAAALIAARAYARWNYGDPNVADRILWAYLHPDLAREVLGAEQDA